MTATVSELRALLSQAWGEERVRTVLLRLREQGLLPTGRQGRGGSAEIAPLYAAIALLVLALDDGDAIAAITRAERVGAFKLVAIDQTGGATATRRPVQGSNVRLVTAMAGDIATAARDPGHHPKGWRGSGDEVVQDAAERLVFRDASMPAGGSTQIIRETVIPGKLVREIGHLFAPAAAEAA
jgi:hypothetical protein